MEFCSIMLYELTAAAWKDEGRHAKKPRSTTFMYSHELFRTVGNHEHLDSTAEGMITEWIATSQAATKVIYVLADIFGRKVRNEDDSMPTLSREE